MDLYTAKTPAFATSAASTKTLLQLACPATIRARLANFTVSFDGSTAAQAILVELLYQTTAGTGTALTPNATDSAAPASLVTAAYNHTVEPSAGSILKGWEVRPDGGLLDIPFYDIRMPVIAASGRLALRYTTGAGVSPNVSATMDFWA